MAQGGKVKTTPNPSRAYIYPPLDGPHTRENPYDWVMVCFAFFAGFVTCYLMLTN